MRFIISFWFPPKGYVAMTIWPFVFYRKDSITPQTTRHELIHGKQQAELLLIGFYLLYGLSYVWNIIRCLIDKQRGTRADGKHRSLHKRAYRSIIFEREAYAMENVEGYLQWRDFWAFIHF